jgi:hypothetical protein
MMRAAFPPAFNPLNANKLNPARLPVRLRY